MTEIPLIHMKPVYWSKTSSCYLMCFVYLHLVIGKHFRSSTSTAAAAFAIATSASSNPRDDTFEHSTIKEDERNMVSSPATIRVLNVLRYVSKMEYQCQNHQTVHPQQCQWIHLILSVILQALGFEAFSRFWTRCWIESPNN